METFSVVWTEQSKRSLEKLERDVSIRIIRKVEACRSDPYRFMKKLVGGRAWRLRVGDWRVLVDLEGEKGRIVVLEVGHRRNIYK